MMKRGLVNKLQYVLLVGFLTMTTMIFSPFILNASENQANEGDWEFMAELYLWYASIGGEAGTGEGVDIGAGDLIDGLNLAFMGNVGMKKDRWGVMIDGIYLNSSDNQNLNTALGGLNVSAELSSWIVTPMIGYEAVQSGKFSMNVVAGARYLYLNTDVDLRNADPDGTVFNTSISVSDSYWDGIVGVRGDLFLSENWFIPYHIDIGTGASDLTWQAFAGLGYRFEHFDILAGYRYLSWSFDDNELFSDLNVSGVGAGIKLKF